MGIKEEPLDDVEVSKVVLTELPLKSVFLESTSLDALQKSTPLSPAHIEENISRTQEVQTDEENWNHDSLFEESSTEQEECPNPEVC